MRANEFLVEVERLGDITGIKPEDVGDIQQSIDYFYGDFMKERGIEGKGKIIGKIEGYDIEHYVSGDSEYFFLLKDDRAVFYLAVKKMLDGYSVGNIRSAVKGMATKMYSYVLDKGPLYSDKAQTSGGRAVWNKLAKNPTFKMTAIDIKTGQEWDIRSGEKEVSGKMIRVYDKVGPGNKHNIRLKLAKK